MNPAVQQFLSVALPIMVTLVATIWIAQWSQNKRFDDVNKRIDDLRSDMNYRFEAIDRRLDAIEQRLERIESKLENHDQRITRGGRTDLTVAPLTRCSPPTTGPVILTRAGSSSGSAAPRPT